MEDMAILQVTPNGPYGKDVHPQLPVSLEEVIEDLRSCFEAGARGVHLHTRDRQGSESLRPGDVNRTVIAVRGLADQCGIDVEIGLTTGAWIVPDLQSRIDMISDWEDVDCATANLSDQVMEAMRSSGIGIDVSLWDLSEIERFARLRIRPSRAACQDRAGPR